ncbi:hypothetical protein LZ198_36985 [Myxococcus sp. K15C18031901]|uniref:hypothetical protein n=1 Tax=Myxococcus dinghuensis TaxID=2906761 RepID=UPI0020A7202C|nr:hypothetical protein [Myxococcus dinghuensis]MCP3104473.1 hypothetical protein [Myxococcus dinghuensis]
MKRTLTLAASLSLLSMSAFAATNKTPTATATQKPAAEAPAKPAGKAKNTKEHAAHAKGAQTPAKDSATH